VSNTWQFKVGNPEYERYIHSAGWRKIAEQRLELDNHICPVCGGEATDVHHLTYEHFRHESMDDLVSLCRKCHNRAESFYDPAITPWAMDEVKPKGNNFMAAMRVDALQIAPKVYEYLTSVRGSDFQSLMALRQPDDAEKKKYWSVLKKAVNALCRKRYSRNCVEDRRIMMLGSIANHVTVILLAQIEHYARNAVQQGLHEIVKGEYDALGKWTAVSKALGISSGTTQKLRTDDGTSFGPSLRESVLYYCGLDAAAGIRPISGFVCLSDDDYETLNAVADYMASVSGDGAFKGEYTKEEQPC
jgi:hypothetical protein